MQRRRPLTAEQIKAAMAGCECRRRPTGAQPSPSGLGYCGRCLPIGARVAGKDKNLWETRKDRLGRVAWRRVGRGDDEHENDVGAGRMSARGERGAVRGAPRNDRRRGDFAPDTHQARGRDARQERGGGGGGGGGGSDEDVAIEAVEAEDRLRQALAQLSLSRVESQFPVRDLVVRAGDAADATMPLEHAVDRRLRSLLASLSTERVVPRSLLRAEYVSGAESARWPEDVTNKHERGRAVRARPTRLGVERLPSASIDVGGAAERLPFDIAKRVSYDTAQGTVYAADVHVNPQYHYVVVDLAPPGGDRRGAAPPRRFVARDVRAIMKKSPIYDVRLWYQYVALRSLRDALTEARVRTFDALPEAQRARLERAFDYAGIAGGPSSVRVRADLERAVAALTDALQSQYDDPNNDAYVDAVGYWLGSRLVETNVTPFFPLLYGTMRAYDSAYFAPDSVPYEVLGAAVNDYGFPVQLTLMQALYAGSAGDAYRDDRLRRGGVKGAPLDAERVDSLLAQVTFGLAAAQHAFDLVQNDFHAENLLGERTPDDYALYYERPSAVAGGAPRHYRVPTHGTEWKMIDFGRATFKVGGTRVGATTARDDTSGWRLTSRGNDLTRFAVSLARGTPILKEATRDPALRNAAEMINEVVSCGPHALATDVLRMAAACKNERDPLRATLVDAALRRGEGPFCDHYAVQTAPYIDDGGCPRGPYSEPAAHLDRFERFRVDAADVPPDAVVYHVPA